MSCRYFERRYDIQGGEENAARHRCEERRMLRFLEMLEVYLVAIVME